MNHPNRSRASRPRELLRALGRDFPGIWRMLDQARQGRGQGGRTWPDHVYIPMDVAGIVLVRWLATHHPDQKVSPDILVQPAGELSCLAAWRMGQGVYRFAPDLYQALLDTPLHGRLPSQALVRLPEWCVYIETPGMEAPLMGGGTTPLHGTWCWLDHSQAGDLDILCIGHDTDQGLAISHVPLLETLEEALEAVEREWEEAVRQGAATTWTRGYARAAAPVVSRVLSLLLYLCSQRPDVAGDWPPPRPRPTRTRKGWRVFPAQAPRSWDVGVRLASMAGTEKGEGGSSSPGEGGDRRRPRPHLRRGHWHHYWTGPRDGERRLVLRWVHPTLVAASEPDGLPATIREVGK